MNKFKLSFMLLLPLILMAFSSYADVCDVDDDGDIDIVDIRAIFADRNQPLTGLDDPRDADNDGVISVRDARICQFQCTLPRCVSPVTNQPPVASAGLDQSQPIFSLVQLDGSGSTDADGDPLTFNWQILSRPAGSTASLSDPNAVMPTFTIDVTGDYIVALVVNDGAVDSASDTVLVSTENTPPTADAGPDQSGQLFDTITLDGSASDDANNDALSFNWSFLSQPLGSTASLDDTSAVMPSFAIDVTGDYILQLIVNDGLVASVADTVTVSTDNTPPVAAAGPNQSGQINDIINLDGSSSSDVNADPLTYSWSFTSIPLGSVAALLNPNSSTPSFTIDSNGDYVVQLIVNDGQDDSVPDTLVVSTDNTPPIANAGADDSAQIGQIVTLDGSASTDADGDSLTYLWSFISVPPGSLAVLSDPSAINPSFTLDVTGDYSLQLVVNDGSTDSAADGVLVSTDNTPPVANAGPDQTPLVGDTVTLDGTASADANGDPLSYLWSITDNPGGSTASLSDPSAVNPTLAIDLPGSYEISLLVNDGLADSAVDTVMLITANSAPVADAGADQTALVGATATLDATGSTDVDGDPLSYHWSILSQPAGSVSVLSDGSASMPTLPIDLAGIYQLQLIVNDGTIDSAPDTTSISTDNSAPVANAGPDQSPFVNELVTLDGSASSDVDGDPLTFNWSLTTIPAGSSASLTDSTAVMPTFTVDQAGTYVAQLTVNDGSLDSAPDAVSLSTLNSAPSANAGLDQSVDLGDTAQLDGSASLDIDGDVLTYNWSLTSVPAGSSATLDDNTLVNPQFNVDLAGDYIAQLVVNDGLLDSAPDTVTVTTNNTRPVADAGPAQTPAVGAIVTLDGSASSDADGDSLTFNWSLLSTPPGSSASLSDATVVAPSFTPDQPGTYVAQLIVNDGTIDSLPDTVSLITQNRAPTADAGVDFIGIVGQSSVFDGSGSSDPDADSLTFNWSLSSVPAGSSATLSADSSVAPSLTPDVAGTYTLSLVVNDGTVDSAADTVDLVAMPPLLDMSVTLESLRVGVGRSITGSVTLSAPAPIGGVSVNLTSSQTTFATVAPASIFIAEGDSQGSFTVNGIAEGSSVITAAATGYNNATGNVLVTSALITLGNPGTIAPGQTTSIAVSISTPAPVGGVTVNLTSSDPAVVSVTSSVFIPEGAQVPAANPTVTGDQVGTASILATGDLFAPDSRDIPVSLNITFNPDPATITETTSGSITVNLSAPAPTGGLTLSLVSANTAVATVDATVTIPQGQLSSSFNVNGISTGNTQVTASATGIASVQLSVEVTTAPPINFSSTNLFVGKDLQANRNGSIGLAAPAGNLPITITSSDPSKVLLANTAAGVGSASITVQVGAGSTFIPSFSVKALDDSGIVAVNATAPGYASGSFNVELVPSGIIINSPSSFSTTTFANNTNIQLASYRLNPTTLTIVQSQLIRAGTSVDVTVTSSDPTVGVISSSPVTMNGNDNTENTSFDPINAGTSDISVVTPTGFSTPSNFQQITATVNAPNINMGNVNVGEDLQQNLNISLQSAPPAPVDVTVTIDDPSVAILSDSATTVGSNSVTFSAVSGSFVGTLRVQGLSVGTATITATAAGYNNDTSTVTVDPSGFIINSPGSINTTTFSNNSNVQIAVYRLNPTTMGISQSQVLRPGVNVTVPVTSSNTAVGVITSSPVAINANDNIENTQFDPLSGGTTTISVSQPAGFDTPSNFQSITATVSAPNINVGNATVGEDLQQNLSISLQTVPPSPLDVTVTIDDPSIAILSSDPTVVGSNSVTFTGVTSSFVGTIRVQGLLQGSATLTTSAPGYNTDSSTVNVHPSGFIINSPSSLNTTTFSNNSNIQIASYRLNPTTLAISSSQVLRAGVNVTVPVTSSDTNVGVITTSPVAINQNDNLENTQFDPISAGSTVISVTQPTGFDTPSNFQSINATVNAPNINISNIRVGKDLQVAFNVSLQAAPPAPTDVIIASTAPGIVIVSDNATALGSADITVSGVTGTFVGSFRAQGLALGSTTINVTAAGYNDGTSNVIVDPSGFIFNSPSSDFSIAEDAANRNLQIVSYRLNPTTLNISASQVLRGGITVDVSFASSAAGVGVVTPSPITFNGNSNVANTAFDPIGQGTTQIEVLTPAGFSPSSNFRQLNVTVTPP